MAEKSVRLGFPSVAELEGGQGIGLRLLPLPLAVKWLSHSDVLPLVTDHTAEPHRA